MKLRILLGVAFLWALPSWTADAVQPLDVKPGLWETTTTTEMGGMPPMPADVLAKMTPEQRAKMEAAMKARAAQGAKTTTRRTCWTKEELSKPLTFGDDDKSCQRTIISSSRSKQEGHLECTQRDDEAQRRCSHRGDQPRERQGLDADDRRRRWPHHECQCGVYGQMDRDELRGVKR